MFTILFTRMYLTLVIMFCCYVGLKIVFDFKVHERRTSWFVLLFVLMMFFIVGSFVGLHYFLEAAGLTIKLLDTLAARL